MDALRKDASISYFGIANEIEHWCSYSTIRRWVISREGYRMFTERVIPLLNVVQKEKHFSFAKRLVSNWLKGKGKYLLIHYDEKWFWGMLFRKTQKCFDDLPKAVLKAYHKCHISKQWALLLLVWHMRTPWKMVGMLSKYGLRERKVLKLHNVSLRIKMEMY
jgi:hypothetical protein